MSTPCVRLSPLVVPEEENLVFLDRAADGPAELVLVKGAAGWREVVTGVEGRIAQELEDVAVEGVGTRLS